jgi:FkbM family methyltransferase
MKIYYGISGSSIDVTDICLLRLTNNNIITIPYGDGNRAHYFTDPLVGILKKIMISINDILTEYDTTVQIQINVLDNTITTINENDVIDVNKDINNKIAFLHSQLKINYGSLHEELPEQKMAVRYLTGNEKVLEIGGNIGRNSLVIASILHDSANLVTLECDTNIAAQLTENRDLNNLKFHIENSALSARKLIQQGWTTVPSDTLLDGYTWVNTISINNLREKYNIEFDTLVLDCEGAFYYILQDMPEILNNINLIIMENDYVDMNHKNYIDEIMTQNNFRVDYKEGGGWGPCCDNFFEVWKRSV